MELDLRMARTRDMNALMRAVLLLGLTGFLAKLVLNGELSQYIHPKFTWFISSAGIGLFLMAIGQLRRWMRGSSGVIFPFRYRLYTVLTLVICTGFLLRPHTFGSDLALKQGLNVTNRSTGRTAVAAPATAAGKAEQPAATGQAGNPADKTVTEAPSGQVAAPSTPPAQPDTSAGQPDTSAGQPATSPGQPATAPGQPPDSPGKPGNSAPPAQPDAPAGQPTGSPGGSAPGNSQAGPATEPPTAAEVAEVITITPQNFVQMMFELYDYPEKYAGKRVAMEGFVFHPPDAEEPNFALVRLVVTCHVAHAYPDGLFAYLPGQDRPAQDLWYRLEGQLEPFAYRGDATLKIRVEKVTPIEKPVDPYVYP